MLGFDSGASIDMLRLTGLLSSLHLRYFHVSPVRHCLLVQAGVAVDVPFIPFVPFEEAIRLAGGASEGVYPISAAISHIVITFVIIGLRAVHVRCNFVVKVELAYLNV